MNRIGLAASAVLALGAVTASAPAAQAADFCASKIGGATYYQKDFSHNGRVAATICATGSNQAGTAYLYARGSYANVSKYMSLSIETVNKGTVQVSGNYTSYVYRAIPSGLHNFHAVMKNPSGTTIVDGRGSDYN